MMARAGIIFPALVSLIISLFTAGVSAQTQCVASSMSARMARLEDRLARVEDRLCSILTQRYPGACSANSSTTVTLTDLVGRLSDVVTTFENMNVTLDASTAQDGGVQQPTVCERGMSSSVSEEFLILNNTLLNRKIRCDAQTDGGGWIVFQRRVDGSVNFYKNWAAYRSGFGDLNTNFWLGNQAVYRLTNAADYEMRIDLEFNGQMYYAKYSSFKLENESNKFRLRVGTYSGNVHDPSDSGLWYSKDQAFSTFDRDSDGTSSLNCANNGRSAWWYNRCTKVDLNGEYGRTDAPKGIRWKESSGATRYASFAEMKMRRI